MRTVSWLSAPLLTISWLCVQPALAQQEYPSTNATPESKLTRAPELLRGPTPIFPEAAKAAGLSGDVTLELVLGADGRVQQARVVTAAGHGFDEAALAAVKEFVFSPAEIDGKPTAVSIAYTTHFRPPPQAIELPVTLEGKVLERGTRKPQVGVTVQVGDQTTETDVGGRFALRLAPGSYDISVFDSAHLPLTTRETIPVGQALRVTYYLQPRSQGLFETVVQAEREQEEVQRYTMTRDQLETIPGTFGDPLRVLQDLPGVARAPFLLGNLLVRGTGPNDTQVYIDGIELPTIFHFLAGPSVINPEFIDKLDFWPGGFGPEYGRAIGGTVNLESRKNSDQQWHGSAEVNLLDANAYVNVPILKDLTLSVAGRRSYYDLLLPPVLRAVNASTIITSPYDDYQVLLDYRLDSRNRLQLFAFGSDDALSIQGAKSATSNGFQINDNTDYTRFEASWQYRADRLQSRVQVFAGKDREAFGVGTDAITFAAPVLGMRARVEAPLLRWLSLRAGLETFDYIHGGLTIQGQPLFSYAYRPYPGNASATPPTTQKTTIDGDDLSQWLELPVDLPGGLKLFPGIRFDEYWIISHWLSVADPRLSVREEVNLLGPTAFKASVGLYHQNPIGSQVSPFGGNPNLPLAGALQVSAGVDHTFAGWFKLDVTSFYNHFTNLPEATSAVQNTPTGLVPYFFRGTGEGDAYGLEVFARRDFDRHFIGWLSYTLAFSQLHDPELSGASGEGYISSPYDERHVLTAVASYRFDKGWQVGGRFQLATGLPTTPYTGATFEADSQSYFGIQGTVNSAHLPLYQELDLRIDKEWSFNTWFLGVFLDVRNVYNATNEEAIVYDYRYRTSAVVGGIPFLPNLGVKGRF